jgi:hypothetical protein
MDGVFMQGILKIKYFGILVSAFAVFQAAGCKQWERSGTSDLQTTNVSSATSEVWKGVSVFPNIDLGEGQPCTLKITKDQTGTVVRQELTGTRKSWQIAGDSGFRNIAATITIEDYKDDNPTSRTGLSESKADFKPKPSPDHRDYTRIGALKLTMPPLPGSGVWYIDVAANYEHVIGKSTDRILGVATGSTSIECKNMQKIFGQAQQHLNEASLPRAD